MKVQRWIQAHTTPITWVVAALIAGGYLSKWLQAPHLYAGLLALASVLAVVPIAMHAWQALRVRVVSIELLVTIAVIGAFVIGEYNESAIVTFLFLFGNLLEQKTLAKTRSSIRSLTEMAPTTADRLREDGTTETVDVDELEKGDVVVVRPGAALPVDGTVADGDGYVDEAAITGESRPVHKTVGASVYAGAMLSNGFLHVQATKVGDDTTFAKIVELVEEAQDTKSHAEKFIDRFAQYYTPAVLVIALLVGLVTQDLRLAITVLVLGCPGALVIGAPVSNVAGIGNGAKHGILVKGGAVMDDFAKIDTFVFDKTGTLTQGRPAVTALTTFAGDEAEVLAQVAKLESRSDHPLGQAIIQAAEQRGLQYAALPLAASEVIKGEGVTGTIAGHRVCAGNAKLLARHGVALTEAQQTALTTLQQRGASSVLVAIDGALVQLIGIADQLRPEVPAALVALTKAGAQHLVMLTGDNRATATTVARQLGIDEVHAELLPADKVAYVKKMQVAGRHVAFVGDGINDSPSIATADIGIAMGSGTDVAIETSDVVLVQANFQALVHAYQLAKKTVRNTRENVVIAIAVVAFLLIGLIAGFIYMASGMFVHEASILVVIFNAMRLIDFGGHQKKQRIIASA
ncbi:heavy metal translocating P-type ATPase [Lacticaseibacillus yichunensis]|uniref:Cd(2+)-exporting ATPase n=1 Tax=Lacticaseibacillus yichunensis TaxID=2486015 RepID=A0ABW4CR26_9LACO|nr:heavy metal translocating P-type ATPase [Lacticaseibacillus yichunensis]